MSGIEENKYSNGKICKLICLLTGNVYVGSTCETLDMRLSEHIKHYKQYKSGTRKNMCSSKYVLENNNYDFNTRLFL